MDPTVTEPAAPPSVSEASMSAPNSGDRQSDPLVNVWFNRIKSGEKHWEKLHQRMRYNRKLVRGIDDNAEPKSQSYNTHRANLIQSTLTVVLSKVYAKNPEMSAEPTNKAQDLRLFADTVSTVTQTMLEAADLKQKAKASVRAAMTCSYGVVKVQYQRVTAGEQNPIIRQRIQDTQDNILRVQSLIAECEDDDQRGVHEQKQRELQEALAGLQADAEVVAAEGLVIDRVRSDRLIIDPAIEDVWEYESAAWMSEKIPMRKSMAKAMFPAFDLSTATTFREDNTGADPSQRRRAWMPATAMPGDDPIIMVHEVWSRLDNRIYTLVEGCNKQFARAPYTPPLTGERWWAHFLLPFQSVDGEFAAQSLVDVLEKLQEEHNETRDKFANLRRLIKPHYVASADLKDKDIQKKVIADLGEVITINANGPLRDAIQPGVTLAIDPAVFDTGPIRTDWEMVSGLQDAARSIVVQPKTATEASISDQALAARVSEFRDQIEDWLTAIAQYASELCLLAMTPQMVETIMGSPKQPDPQSAAAAAVLGQPPPEPVPTYFWPQERKPETVFNLIQLRIRSGSTAAPNRLQMQENWNKALQLLMPMVDKIRALDAAGADSSPERELVRETAARFDETIDVDRFLPPKPIRPAMPVIPGAATTIPAPAAAMPHQGGTPLAPPTVLQ